MRRLQIYLDEELDDALAAKARKEGTSKAALIRSYVAEHIEPLAGADPLDEIVGQIKGDPGPETIDEVVYDLNRLERQAVGRAGRGARRSGTSRR